jgi:hypothetical protein
MGCFSLTECAQNAGTFSLEASAPGFASTTTALFTLSPGATLAVGAIQLGQVALGLHLWGSFVVLAHGAALDSGRSQQKLEIRRPRPIRKS